MEVPSTLIICLKPFTCQEKECQCKDSLPCALQVSIDNTGAIPLSLKNVHSSSKASDRKRIKRGKHLHLIERLEIKDKVLELLNNKQLTYDQIVEAIFNTTGKKISRSSLSRYYQNIIKDKYESGGKEEITRLEG